MKPSRFLRRCNSVRLWGVTRQWPRASAKQVKGTVKQVVGKAAGDTKLESERKAERIEDKVHNAIGGFKDTAQGEIDVAASSFVPTI